VFGLVFFSLWFWSFLRSVFGLFLALNFSFWSALFLGAFFTPLCGAVLFPPVAEQWGLFLRL